MWRVIIKSDQICIKYCFLWSVDENTVRNIIHCKMDNGAIVNLCIFVYLHGNDWTFSMLIKKIDVLKEMLFF